MIGIPFCFQHSVMHLSDGITDRQANALDGMKHGLKNAVE
jgi:hypothetical protein